MDRRNEIGVRLQTVVEGMSPGRLSALMGAMVVAIAGLLAASFYGSYLDTRRGGEQTAATIANALAQDIDRAIKSLDLSLQAAVDGWRQRDVHALSPELRNMVLFDRSASNQEMGSVVILDATGKVVMDSKSVVPRKGDLSDRVYFRAHRDDPGVELFIGEPLVSRLTGEWTLSLSRRLTNVDGSFGGVVTGGIKLNYFRTMFERIGLGANSSIALLSTQGRVLMRIPFRESFVGMTLPDRTVLQEASNNQTGVFRANSVFDGVDRLEAYHRIGGLPLVQTVALSWQDIFSAWWTKTTIVFAVFFCLSLAIAFVTAIFAHELRRRIRAEAELALAARTDALTGLGNRRRFDDGLHYEWRRAIASRQSTALMIIDVDDFKTFNDTYGHVAGDAALGVVADCIRSVLRAPADIGARYGGEEFAIILPNTTLQRAARIAATLQKAIADAGIEHRRSPHAVLTVSIGVAAGGRQSRTSEIDLVRDADAALYSAKAGGRNKVMEMHDHHAARAPKAA